MSESRAGDMRYGTDTLLMSVLSSRFEAIIRDMTNTVMKASRSAVIKNARDMSCGLLTFDHRLVCVEEAMPIHVSALELTTKPITEFFDDIEEGDAFLNNSPYTGGTHHADLTVCTPVFCDGEPLFWTLARSHHADIGAPSPTTYLPYGATIYEEGDAFPLRSGATRVERPQRHNPHGSLQDSGEQDLVWRLSGPDRGLPKR